MENTITQKINTYLPIFSGFYNTIWNFQEENVIYNINDNREVEGDINFEHLEIDYVKYENDVAKQLCEVIKDKLSDYIENIEFQKIYSPKTYNFSTDSIDVSIIPNIENIKKFIYAHKNEFNQYLKNKYTSYDGFISHYDNSFEAWEDDTQSFNDLNINSHALGSILDFIAHISELEEVNIYEYVMENIYYDNYVENYELLENALICHTCDKLIDDNNIIKQVDKYKDIMNKYPSKVLCIDCLENY